MASTQEAIIAVQGYDSESPSFKLLRLVATRDGSYSISAPYHPAKSGLLFKAAMPTWAEGSPQGLPVAPQIKYRVDVPVKMSFHPSGFVQFSSVGPAPIRSGRTKFHVPRGLGIQSHDILNPIDSGPTWGATFFNASECEVVTGTEQLPVMLFRPGDYFERDEHDLEGRHIFQVEAFTFPHTRRREVFLGAHGWTLRTGYGVYRPEWEVDFRVFDLLTPVAFLGLTVSLRHGPPDMGGGYGLSSPKDIVTKATLQGMFPFPEDWSAAEGAGSLAYIPERGGQGKSTRRKVKPARGSAPTSR